MYFERRMLTKYHYTGWFVENDRLIIVMDGTVQNTTDEIFGLTHGIRLREIMCVSHTRSSASNTGKKKNVQTEPIHGELPWQS